MEEVFREASSFKVTYSGTLKKKEHDKNLRNVVY